MTDRPSLQSHLEVLQQCGVPLPDGLTLDDMLAEWGADAFEEDPFRMLAVCIGADEREPPSDHLWHFDTECIEGDGAYVRIAERMRHLARGDLPLTNVRDRVDFDEGVAWLAFDLDGETIRWELELDNDWVDASVFTEFAELLERRRTGKRFTYLDLGGQDCIIGCATPETLAQLNARTGLQLTWLS